MFESSTRRKFLGDTIFPTILAGTGWSFLSQLPFVTAEETLIDSHTVQLRPEIEPLVRLLEDTPRDRVIEEVVTRIRGGLSYPELVAALLLAGVRNVEPRPAVGFKFHAVLVVNSAHLTSVSSPGTDRWLPILWAIDNFKASQARDIQEGNWTMAPVKESAIPPAHEARGAFVEAMKQWDEEAADAAIAGLSRTAGTNELFELLAQYAARDLRSIGHKAIFMANAWRSLQFIGWQHAETVLRSLTYAMLNHQGEPNPGQHDLEQDRPWRRNELLTLKIRPDWKEGRLCREATKELLETLRNGSPEAASENVVELLNRGVHPQSIYDALFAGSAELMMRQPAIPALHSVTTTNAVHYLYQASGNDETRRKLLLQNAAFLPLFREFMRSRGAVGNVRIDALEGVPAGADSVPEMLAEPDPMTSARKIVGYATDPVRAQGVIQEARRVTFLKGRDAHHYKFSSAVLEDYFQVSPFWRERLLAACVLYLPSGGVNPLVEQVRQALG